MDHNSEVIVGNYFNKHETRNPLYQSLVKNYKKALQEIMSDLPGKTGLEIGSGEGYILSYIAEVQPELRMVGSDISADLVVASSKMQTPASWAVLNGENLPFPAKTFDIVVACEVLEHLEHPAAVLEEIRRISNGYLLVSVPQEPIWRVLNVLRLKYLKDLGNTPGHLQHWSVAGIERLISQFFNVQAVTTSFPWTFVVAKVS